MVRITKTKIVSEILVKLSSEDYIAGAILTYIKQDDLVYDMALNPIDNNKESFCDEISKLGELRTRLKELLSYELNIKEDINLEELIAKYLINNFSTIYCRAELLKYYQRIFSNAKKMQNYFSVDLVLAILIKASNVIEKLYEEGNYEVIEKFVSMLEKNKYSDDNIIYVVYSAFYDQMDESKKVICNHEEEIVNNNNVAKALLNEHDFLPQSIITHLCEDKQFQNISYDSIFLALKLFFIDGSKESKNRKINKLDIVQKLFENNVRDFSSEAIFLDLSDFLNSIESSLQKADSSFDFMPKYMNIIKGLDNFERVKESSYGTV